MANKEEGVFLTQKGKRRGGQAEDAVDADQLEEMVAGVAQTSQSTLLLKKKKEMREVCPRLCRKDAYITPMNLCVLVSHRCCADLLRVTINGESAAVRRAFSVHRNNVVQKKVRTKLRS